MSQQLQRRKLYLENLRIISERFTISTMTISTGFLYVLYSNPKYLIACFGFGAVLIVSLLSLGVSYISAIHAMNIIDGNGKPKEHKKIYNIIIYTLDSLICFFIIISLGFCMWLLSH